MESECLDLWPWESTVLADHYVLLFILNGGGGSACFHFIEAVRQMGELYVRVLLYCVNEVNMLC